MPDSADEATYVDALNTRGFALRIREADCYEHRMLASQHTGITNQTVSGFTATGSSGGY